jgi:hypothetical protein
MQMTGMRTGLAMRREKGRLAGSDELSRVACLIATDQAKKIGRLGNL